jgi:ParB-like chromosome segregation protein Spo0J
MGTQPIVGMYTDSTIEVVDGFHRSKVGKDTKDISQRVYGYLPVVQIRRTGLSDRMAATIRHNRARGVHGVHPMTDIVASLIKQGMTDKEIGLELGMGADEVLRLKQLTGIPDLFKGHVFSKSWE